MIKKYLPVILISIVSSIMGMMIFYHFFNPVKKIYVEQEKRAKETAQREILWSDQYVKSLRTASPTSFVKAAEKSRDAVVYIRSLKSVEDKSYNNSYSTSTGSGVIISQDGYIVTNHHVIEGASDIEVMLNNNKEYDAHIVGTDPSTDLALLKIDAGIIPFLTFGNSDSLFVGEWVMAVGNPFRLQSTVTAGIVSAKARNINILENYGIESFIQTDAAVNPGNSGGALVNTLGELVGINAAIMTYSGKYEGFSFAIPSNLVRKVVDDLRTFGTVQRGWMGVSINDMTSDIAELMELNDVTGVYIAAVNADQAAEEAGLKKGDIITEIDGKKVDNVPSFMELLGQHRPGDRVNVVFIRNSKKMTTEVVLRNQLNSTNMVVVRRDKVLNNLGIEIRDLDDKEKKLQKQGVYVLSIKVNSIIAETNMNPGFIITHVNNLTVSDADMLVKYLQENKGEIVLEGFYENYPGEYPYRFIIE